MNDVLRLEGIAKTYNPGTPGAVDVLRGLDLTVAQGEVVALVAPSGAGKSTIVKLLARFYDPTAGAVRAVDSTPREASTSSVRWSSIAGEGPSRPGCGRWRAV